MWTKPFFSSRDKSFEEGLGRQTPAEFWWHATISLLLGYLVWGPFFSLPYNFLSFSSYALITLRNGKSESHGCSNLLGFLKTASWDP